MTLHGRIFGALCAATLLAGCGNAPGQTLTLDSVRGLFASLGQEAQPALSLAQVRAHLSAQPEAVDRLTTGKVMLVEGDAAEGASAIFEINRNGDVITYTTTAGATFSFRNGILIATRGWGFDLMSADVAELQAAIGRGGGRSVRVHRYLDGDDQTLIRSFRCAVQVEDVVTEQCYGNGTRFTNTYSVDANGAIVKSRQWIGPVPGFLYTETFR